MGALCAVRTAVSRRHSYRRPLSSPPVFSVLSFPQAYAWLLFFHHVAAGGGALVFFRRLGAGRSAAVCGAVVYMLSGYVVGLMNAGSLMAGAAYVPWVLA